MRAGSALRQAGRLVTFGALTPGYYDRTLNVVQSGISVAAAAKLYVPTGYDPSVPWPLILSGHGSGENYNGSNAGAQLGVGLGAHVAAVGEQAVIAFPQFQSGNVTDARAMMAAAYADARALCNINPKKMYYNGNSAGAELGWGMVIAQFTGLLAAFLSTSGQMFGYTNAAALSALTTAFPILLVHGSADGTLPVSSDRATAAAFGMTTLSAMNGSMGTQQYVEYAGLDHGPTWDAAYADANCWTWLFAKALP